VRATEILDEILEGRGTQAHLELLGEINETMRVGSLCALGGGIPIPVENLLTTFVRSFERYVPGAKAPAVV
jgi:formate dehydrogenase iron-sulfur subunit